MKSTTPDAWASFPDLDLPATAALPNSYYWTWDHSTNWVFDDPGVLNLGCHNRYMKRPETYIEDYRRLIDHTAATGVKGLIIWGFLRDDHGGVESAKRVADYAASKGVAIMPGVGTTHYGGMYYEGNHPFNIETFLAKHPQAAMIGEDGKPHGGGLCPSHPGFLEWLHDGMQWLFKEFAIGGVNLENGDFLVCHCKLCQEHKNSWPASDPDFFRLQAISYDGAMRALGPKILREKIVTYATYKGYQPGKAQAGKALGFDQFMECDRPAMLDRLPADAIAQWTLSSMLGVKVLTTADCLDDGKPAGTRQPGYWPAGRAPAPRNTGFIHQASQWDTSRYDHIVGMIKQTCYGAYASGMEGASIHGEVSSRIIPYGLNYLAFSHFIHWPEDTLRRFGRRTLGRVLRSEDHGESFVEILSRTDSAKATDEDRQTAKARAGEHAARVAAGHHDTILPWRYWDWLNRMAHGKVEKHTVSFL